MAEGGVGGFYLKNRISTKVTNIPIIAWVIKSYLTLILNSELVSLSLT